MVTCGRQPANMLPMAPINAFLVGFPSAVTTASPKPNSTTIVTSSPVSKPRIAFSIDSIVGGGNREASEGRITQTTDLDVISSLSSRQRSESPEPVDTRVIDRSPSNSCEEDLQSGEASGLEIGKSEPSRLGAIYCRRGASLEPSPECSPLGNRSRSPLIYGQARPQTPTLSPSKQPPMYLPQASTGRCAPLPASSANQAPLVVPGISAGLLRPLPLQAPNMKLVPRTNIANEAGVSSLLVAPPPAPLPPPPHPHFLAAHFQMAAALAHHSHQQQHQPNQDTHLPPGNPMGFFSPAPHQPNFGGPHHQLIRDSYPLYPWLLSRHGRIFPHRFPGNFLLQPFRKPKRVRTAFSPTQLLKLEHAFEGNHYVVGAERKQLAQGLSLTETQVKVWFQNRRTKHKRMQQEDGEAKSNNKGEGESRNDSSQNSFEDQEEEELEEEDLGEEDEVIDMDDYGAEMDTEEHETIRAQFQQQLQHHQQQLRHHVLQQQDPPLHAQRDEQQQSQQHQQQQHLMEQHYFVQHQQNQRKH